MKKVLKALGAALLYCAFYFLNQIVLANLAIVLISFTASTTDEMYAIYGAMEPVILIMAAVLSGALLYAFFKVRGRSFRMETHLLRFRVNRTIWLPVILGLCLPIAITLLMMFIPFPQTIIDFYNENVSTLSTANPVLDFLSTVIVAPIIEEILNRGIVLSRLRTAMPLWLAVVLCSLLFGVEHFDVYQGIYTFLISLVMCLVTIKFDSIYPSMIVHMLFNLLGTHLDFLNVIPTWLLVVVFALSLGGTVFAVWRLFKLPTPKPRTAVDEVAGSLEPAAAA